jgi:hypothetical protein
MLRANVNPDGTLAASSGVTANYHDAKGKYRIVFNRSIASCTPLVTGSGAPSSTSPGVTASVLTDPALPNQVTVSISIGSASYDDLFYLGVLC